MDNKSRGLYHKFEVRRTDGRSEPGEKHHNCRYFVLDLDHDPLALEAIKAYALAARDAGYSMLASDLLRTYVGEPSSLEKIDR